MALISVTSALGPQLVDFLQPAKSDLQVTSFYATTEGIALTVENQGTRPGQIGRVTLVLYDRWLFFKKGDLPPDQQNAPDWKNRCWGVDLDLGTTRETSRTIPAKSTKELPFLFTTDTLQRIKAGFPNKSEFGDFCTSLYNESIQFGLKVELLDYGKRALPPIELPANLPSPPDRTPQDWKRAAFYRLFDTITAGELCSDF